MAARRIVPCLAAWVVCSTGLCADPEEAPPPEPGPEDRGLRLRLVVTNPEPGGTEEHDIMLELLNVGEEPVALVAESDGAADYAEYLRAATTFTTVPELLNEVWQIAEGEQIEEVEALIRPASAIVSQWRVKGRWMDGNTAASGLGFPVDGRFLIRAHVTVKTKAGDYVRLCSNEQPWIVGGRDSAPRQCVASVLSVGAEKQEVILDVGSAGGARVGDVFRAHTGPPGYWDLHLARVGPERSTASVARKSYRDLPHLPERRRKAQLRPNTARAERPRAAPRRARYGAGEERGRRPAGGPENSGLRLRLVVTNPEPGGTEEHDVRLELLNVGNEPVTVVTRWHYERGGDYAAYLRSASTFTTVPEVLSYGMRTGGRFRKSPQVEAEIGPEGGIVSEWRVRGRRIFSPSASRGLSFPVGGRFLMRAHATVRTRAGKDVRVWSNEQPFVVGGRDSAPRRCVATVLYHGGEGEQNVGLDVGSVGGAKVGDVFRLQMGVRGHWDLHLTSVDREQSMASVARKSYSDDPRRRLPERRMKAQLLPEGPLLRRAGALQARPMPRRPRRVRLPKLPPLPPPPPPPPRGGQP
ncbi:MAG: hypothetical protein ACYS9X_27795 [Planctomycetota bacterium]|jgi:hypothetical protein